MTWLDFATRKRSTTTSQPQPLSLQQTIGRLSTRATVAEARLEQVRRLHRPDPTGSWCIACGEGRWPCSTVCILDGTGCTSTDPMYGAACDKPEGHVGRHGGMDRYGTWRSWM